MRTNESGTLSKTATIVKAGLIAGTLDILSAFFYYYIKTQKNPVNILKYITTQVFGKTFFTNESAKAAMGLLIHYVIAFIWTIIFFIIYPHIKFFFKSRILTGLVYGIIIWVIMNLVIVPLGTLPKAPFNLSSAIINMLILIIAVGTPISIIVSKYYRDKIF